MAEGAGDGSGGAEGVKPGALTALLQEVAAAPEKREEEPLSLPPGTVVGRFEIIRELGRGGFGVVYEAKDRDLGRQVAVKVVRPGRITEEEGKVSREAEAIARLAHPNLITLFEVGQSEHGPFLVFELLRGKTLDLRIEEGALPVHEAVHIATEVARGLAHAHAEGVIHRDLKPANVFVTNKGQVKILDFGMAHAFGRRRLSGGTPAYMAPEQWEDDPEDERTDVFALGVMLYRMMTGEYPFPEGQGKWSSEPATLRKLDVPGAPELAELVEKMLDRTPKGRPRDGAAVLAALTPIEEKLRARPADGKLPEHAKRRKATFGDVLAELKRRHVFRVMIGYGVFAFAVLQVTEPILKGLRLPEAWLTPVVVLLGLGFPVAAALSWVFDLTRQGIVRTEEATPASRTSPRLAQVGVIVVAAALGAVLAWLALRQGAPQPVADADGRTSVAVADFANSTGEPPLDALSGLLITSLEQSRKLKVLTRGRMLELLKQTGREKIDRIDESAAREVGLKAGVRALLLASIQRLGATYVVELRALDPVKDHYLFTLRDQAADQAAILPLIDRLSERTRLALQEQAADVKKTDIQVASAITPDLEAYRHYFLGQQLVAQMDWEAAVREFRAAVERDPGFTAAKLRLSHVAFGVGPQDLVELATGLLAGAEGLPAKERLLAVAWGSLLAGELARARGAAAQLQRAYPEDRDAQAIGGDVLYATGDLEGAVLAFRAALELDRRDAASLGGLTSALIDAGRAPEALSIIASLGEPPPNWALLPASGTAALVGDVERAGRLARAALEAGNRFDGYIELSMVADARGDRAGLRQALEETERRAENDVVKAWQRLSVMAALGRWREAVPQGEPPPPVGRDGWNIARVLMGTGRTDEARGLVRGLPAVEGWSVLVLLARLGDAERVAAITADLPADGYPRRLGESLLAWLRGDRETALAALRALDTGSRSQVAWLRGTVAAELGKDEEAVDALGRYDRLMRGGGEELERIDMLPRGRITRARSLDRLGRRAEAREVVRRQLDVWRDADADLPLLAEAKTLCRKLGCKAPD